MIPTWIIEGSNEFRRAFLRGLYDDEGCINYEVKRYARRIIMAQGKQESLVSELRLFFEQLREILKDFGIMSGTINIQDNYKGNVVLRFLIQDKESLTKFNEKIGFSHPKKQSVLDKILGSYKDISRNKRKILTFVLKHKCPVTTKEIADIYKLKNSLVKSHLLNLVNEGKIVKTHSMKPTRFAKPNVVFKNYKELLLENLNNEFKSTSELIKNTKLNHKYTLQLLNELKKEGKLISKGTSYRGKYWKLTI